MTNNMFAAAPGYDPEAVRPMWEELQFVGITPLTSATQVDEMLTSDGTVLVVINSVCGCAAGNARPGVALALQNDIIPDHLGTVFAGVDHEAVEQVRSKMPGVQPSSPGVALFENGKPLFVLERRHIENMTGEQVAESLIGAFVAHCKGVGPSITQEVYASYEPFRRCGSTVPRINTAATTS
jgi:putative YphP/YqiW family bacilliredoxin